MKLNLVIAGILVMAVWAIAKENVEKEVHSRSKRNVAQFGLMIKCTTGRSAFDYNGYGCWCGKGGSGRAVDAIDRCCLAHDRCYQSIIRRKDCQFKFQLYTVYYYRQGCNGCAPLTRRRRHGFNNKCQYSLCQCDRRAVLCFHGKRYNNRYKNYNKKRYC
ncbi:acidic phospholipase A2 E-like isoform X2 [Nematostella vectensis]|uniref:acidic phospholipase A2 E-like isoform X2 n=1 Tax=Nematostella vectensis TaxID=45351 RepID=UPI0020778DCB|nr:acidic phospholipase A2 E-like isoform X2 [Nematostella vectensis]